MNRLLPLWIVLRAGLAGLALAAIVAVLATLLVAGPVRAQDAPEQRPAEVEEGEVASPGEPGGVRETVDDSEIWRAIRRGQGGQVSIPNDNARVLIQSEGEAWRAFRNGPLSTWGVWGLAGMVLLLALFFLVRGRVRIEHGRSERTIPRFGLVERTGHWMLATSFILLALTGLNVLYGRYVLLPLIGPEAFTAISIAGKYVHNYVAFAFMIGLALVFVLWVAQNIPDRYDGHWLAKGGGMVGKHNHPPARKFNAGQKIIFWLVILCGVSVSLSGIALLFPYETGMFSKTFAALAWIGFDLPSSVSPVQEQQLNQVWHAIMGLFLTAVIIAHIYIGTIGMEGAFDAMGSGEVDYNWAREHHSVWVEEVEARGDAHRDRSDRGGIHPAPAE